MKAPKEKQSHEAHVPMPAVQKPKGEEQKTFTQKEKDFATRHKVEPKLIRLLNEIVEERLKRLNECIEKLSLLNERIDERFVEPEPIATEPEQVEDKSPTGVAFLDELLATASYPAAVMAYVCLRASWIDNALGDKLHASLGSSVDEMLEMHRKGDRSLDVECEVLPALKWLAFLKGLETGRRDELEIELREPANKEKSPVSQTASAETQEPKPEGEPSLFAVKKWLRKRSYTEKLTAALVGKLIAVESMYEKPDNYIGNDFSSQFESEVLGACVNEVYLKQAPPDEIAATAFVAAMMPVRV